MCVCAGLGFNSVRQGICVCAYVYRRKKFMYGLLRRRVVLVHVCSLGGR